MFCDLSRVKISQSIATGQNYPYQSSKSESEQLSNNFLYSVSMSGQGVSTDMVVVDLQVNSNKY